MGASWRHSRKLQDAGSLVQVLIQIVIHRLCHRKSRFFVEPDGREVVPADMKEDFACTGGPEVLQHQLKGSPAKAFSPQFFIYLEVIEAGGSAFLQGAAEAGVYGRFCRIGNAEGIGPCPVFSLIDSHSEPRASGAGSLF